MSIEVDVDRQIPVEVDGNIQADRETRQTERKPS